MLLSFAVGFSCVEMGPVATGLCHRPTYIHMWRSCTTHGMQHAMQSNEVLLHVEEFGVM
jgi:hypothetical protein